MVNKTARESVLSIDNKSLAELMEEQENQMKKLINSKVIF